MKSPRILSEFTLCPVTIVLTIGMAQAAAWAAEFRVDSAVFIASQKQPVSQNTTVFTDQAVFDFDSRNGQPGIGQATILELDADRITIVDFEHRIVCRLSAEEILRAIAAIVARVPQESVLLHFAANPQFTRHWEPSDDQLQLDAAPMSYRVRADSPPESSIATSYQRFADWSARLNATRPGGLPPAARIQLNQELQQQARVPAEVELTMQPSHTVLRSTHQYSWQLTTADREQTARIRADAQSFKPVNLVDLRLAARSVAAPSGVNR